MEIIPQILIYAFNASKQQKYIITKHRIQVNAIKAMSCFFEVTYLHT